MYHVVEGDSKFSAYLHSAVIRQEVPVSSLQVPRTVEVAPAMLIRHVQQYLIPWTPVRVEVVNFKAEILLA